MDLLEAFVSIKPRGVAETKGAMRSVESEAGKMERSVSSRMKSVGSAMVGAGKQMTTFVTGPLALVGGGMAKLAIDAEETAAKFGTVFGDATGQMNKFITETMKSVPATREELQGMTAELQDFLVPMGIAPKKARDMTKTLTVLTADLASFNNVPVADVQRDIQSALAGSSESMLKYGVDTSVAALETYAYENGLAKQGEELSRQQKIQAIYGQMLADTTKAQGDAARTADSTANSLKFLWRDVKELGTTFGEILVPAIRPVIDFLGRLLERARDMSPTMQRIVVVVAAVAAAIGPALIVLGTLISTIGTITAAVAGAGGFMAVLGTVATFLTGPFGIAIAAAVAAGILLWRNWDRIKQAAQPLITVLRNFGQLIRGAATGDIMTYYNALVKLRGPLQPLAIALSKVIFTIRNFVRALSGNFEALQALPVPLQRVVGILRGAFAAALRFVLQQTRFLTRWWNQNLPLMRRTAQVVLGFIGRYFRLQFNLIRSIVTTVLRQIVRFWRFNWENMRKILVAVWNIIKSVVRTAIRNVLNILKLGMQVITGDWRGAWDTIKTILRDNWNNIKTIVGESVKILGATLNQAWKGIKSAARAAWDAMVGIITRPMERAYDTIQGIWNDMLDGIGVVLEKLGMDGAAKKLSGAKMADRANSKEAAGPGEAAFAKGGVQYAAKGGDFRRKRQPTTITYGEGPADEAAIFVTRDRRHRRDNERYAGLAASMIGGKFIPERQLRDLRRGSRESRGGHDGPSRRKPKNPPVHSASHKRPSGLSGVSFAEGGWWPNVAEMNSIVERKFGTQGSTYPNHGTRGAASAVDWVFGSWGVPASGSDKDRGDKLAGWLEANRGPGLLDYQIWQDQINSGGGWTGYDEYGYGRGSSDIDSMRHMDHAHATFFQGALGKLVKTAGKFLGGAVNALKSAGWDKFVQPIIDSTMKKLNSGPLLSRMAGGAFKQTTDAIKQWISGKAGSSGTGYSGGGNVTEWIRKGLPIGNAIEPTDANVRTMEGRAMQESGGDPAAKNLWDSNAARGTPSQGLFQLIEPTANAYLDKYGQKLGPFASNWSDPVWSTAIASRYMRDRYGGPVGANGQGYDTGAYIKQDHIGAVHRGEVVLPLKNPSVQSDVTRVLGINELRKEMQGLRQDNARNQAENVALRRQNNELLSRLPAGIKGAGDFNLSESLVTRRQVGKGQNKESFLRNLAGS